MSLRECYDALHRLLPPVLEPLCIAWLLGWSLHARGSVVRLLETGPIPFLGIISYSLYLWQQLFTAPPIDSGNVGWLLFCPLMIAFATLSYYLVERPCARFAKRLGRVGAGQRAEAPTLIAQTRVRSAG